MEKYFESVDKSVREYQDEICKLSDSIWDLSEVAFCEHKSSKLMMEELKKHGFSITSPIAAIPTAFSASFGSGHPVVAFLAEYDSLSNLSQKADSTQQEAIVEGESGHGCGHNILGAGCFGAAIAVKDYIEKNNMPGTVILFGCPAEEGGSGKTFMARSGAFDDVDIALSWHPDSANAVHSGSTLAGVSMRYVFNGKAAHAAGCPHLGRSALDAVELMNVGCNYLREHIIPEARVHYAVTDTGGHAPNIVQAHAESVYLIRAPKNEQVAEITERMNDIARGAALMTGTEVEIVFRKACSYFVPNTTVSYDLYEAMKTVPLPAYTDDDFDYAQSFRETYVSEKEDKKESLFDTLIPYAPSNNVMTGSTDVSDVSMNCPTAWFFAATYAKGTPFHSWQMVAQGKSNVAHKGLIYASKVMALTAVSFLNDPEKVKKAKEELLVNRGTTEYICPIPDHVAPEIPKE